MVKPSLPSVFCPLPSRFCLLSSRRAFSLIELMLVIAIFLVTAISTVPMISYYQERQTVSSLTVSIVQVLRLAQGKSLSRTNGMPWGVYIPATRESITLFNGKSYDSRDPVFDQVLAIRLPYRLCMDTMPNADADATLLFPFIPEAKNDLHFLELYSQDAGGERSVIHVNRNGTIRTDQDPTSVCH